MKPTNAVPMVAAPTVAAPSVTDCFADIFRDPQNVLISRWNWKSAMFSSVLRAGIFFSATASAGIHAALGAMYAEFVYRSITAGFYGALTQKFRKAEPQWQATMVAGAGIPIFSHAIELSVHVMRGTPNLRTNIIASVCFTIISTLFNLHAMREGVLVVGESGGSLASDMRCIPRTILSFLMLPFRRDWTQ